MKFTSVHNFEQDFGLVDPWLFVAHWQWWHRLGTWLWMNSNILLLVKLYRDLACVPCCFLHKTLSLSAFGLHCSWSQSDSFILPFRFLSKHSHKQNRNATFGSDCWLFFSYILTYSSVLKSTPPSSPTQAHTHATLEYVRERQGQIYGFIALEFLSQNRFHMAPLLLRDFLCCV